MNTENIIAQIDAEISKLQQAKAILANTELSGRTMGNGISSQAATSKLAKRGMSAEGKAKIAKAQKARWAKVRKAAKKTVQA